jgi:hypothetical protein
MKQGEAFQRIRSVRDEFLAARFALSRAIRQVESDANLLREVDEPLAPQHVRNCAENLEITYLLRLFANFEGVLRDYWAVLRPSPLPRRTRMEILMNRIVVVRQIPFEVVDAAHEVRVHRNNIVHPRDEPVQLTFDQCKSRLGFFLSYLPRQW